MGIFSARAARSARSNADGGSISTARPAAPRMCNRITARNTPTANLITNGRLAGGAGTMMGNVTSPTRVASATYPTSTRSTGRLPGSAMMFLEFQALSNLDERAPRDVAVGRRECLVAEASPLEQPREPLHRDRRQGQSRQRF